MNALFSKGKKESYDHFTYLSAYKEESSLAFCQWYKMYWNFKSSRLHHILSLTRLRLGPQEGWISETVWNRNRQDRIWLLMKTQNLDVWNTHMSAPFTSKSVHIQCSLEHWNTVMKDKFSTLAFKNTPQSLWKAHSLGKDSYLLFPAKHLLWSTFESHNRILYGTFLSLLCVDQQGARNSKAIQGNTGEKNMFRWNSHFFCNRYMNILEKRDVNKTQFFRSPNSKIWR